MAAPYAIWRMFCVAGGRTVAVMTHAATGASPISKGLSMTVTVGLRRMCLALVVAAVAPSAAWAAPGSLGSGARPAVAMDAAGTAFIAWIGVQPSVTSLHFCRLPRGAATCENTTTTITTPGTSITAPFVAVDGTTVRVLSYRYGEDVPGFSADYLFVSGDRGDSFENRGQVGTVPFHNAVTGPGAGISLVASAFQGGGVYQRVPTDASPGVTTSALLSTTHVYEGSVGLADASTPVVTYTDGNGAGKVWRCENCTDAKDPNVIESWTGGTDIGNADDAHMAGGPSGLFLKSSDQLVGGNLIVRRYAGGTFGAPVAVPGGTGEHPQSHMTQDPGGRLHVLWPRIDGDAIRLYHATSDDGSAWLQGGLLAGQETIARVRGAAAPDHLGLAVWDTGASGSSEVRFLPFGPTPPAPPPAPPQQVPQTPQTPAPPARYAGPVRPLTVSDRRASYTLTVPRSCVLPGQSFRVTLKWKRKKRKGNLFVKVRRADFYLERSRIKIDRRAPYVHTYTVRAGQVPGSTINLRARAFIKMKRGKSPTKSIRAKVKVCS